MGLRTVTILEQTCQVSLSQNFGRCGQQQWTAWGKNVYIYIYAYMRVCVYMCVCARVCVCDNKIIWVIYIHAS